VTAEAHQLGACDGDRHRVAFYRATSELVEVALDTFAQAFRHGEPVLVIATEAHRQAFRAGLEELFGAEPAALDSRLTMLDARKSLSDFMIDGHPDPERFDATIGDLVRRSLYRGHGLCAFGEMVALLWEDGLPQAALELEQLWNALQEGHAFTLLCAYPTSLVVTEKDPSGYVEVGAAHSSIVSGPPAAADAEVVRHFPAHAGSPRLARDFIRSTLSEWGLTALGDDALLVATELATNSIRHAQSGFSLSLARSSHGLRLAVGDARRGMTTPRPADDDTGGRGLNLVAATARDWGQHVLDSGKLVWAEIDLQVDGTKR
jgi:hypothetical protein